MLPKISICIVSKTEGQLPVSELFNVLKVNVKGITSDYQKYTQKKQFGMQKRKTFIHYLKWINKRG
ncbi:hypothetical protein DTK66_08450 [Lactobacillus sp. M31]|uniref:Uncharacterized protein n=1 Tax=Limosilactobacillus walteri TaxID=2268022 RepID=A0ABR8P8R1_9LACO|nr:hypothetical protein [Limosilactobacillus walteri]